LRPSPVCPLSDLVGWAVVGATALSLFSIIK
jgi:hypothetical protein